MKQLNLLDDLKTKICVKCNESKPISEFYEKEDTNDKLSYCCKKCNKERNQLLKNGLKICNNCYKIKILREF
ncbi:unnamed protein product [marine sediment metagenome]